MIGKDFPPNNFELFGLNLTDPSDFIYNMVLATTCFLLAYKVRKLGTHTLFYKGWWLFFLYLGISTFYGGFGHVFFNYFNVYGKLLSWIFAPISIYWAEIAMISVHKNSKFVKSVKRIFLVKLILVYLAIIVIWGLVDVLQKPQIPFLPNAINSIVGLLIGVGIASIVYHKTQHKNFRYFYFGILAILPSAFIFLMKINLHKWFTKNDFSHLLMLFGIVFFYFGVEKLHKAKQ